MEVSLVGIPASLNEWNVAAAFAEIETVLSCVVDIITAFIPMVLLWKVQMKASTKRSLNLIFSLGLITSSLSIARVATINNKVLTEDTTCTCLLPRFYNSSSSRIPTLLFHASPPPHPHPPTKPPSQSAPSSPAPAPSSKAKWASSAPAAPQSGNS